jgi:hypothetical protein
VCSNERTPFLRGRLQRSAARVVTYVYVTSVATGNLSNRLLNLVRPPPHSFDSRPRFLLCSTQSSRSFCTVPLTQHQAKSGAAEAEFALRRLGGLPTRRMESVRWLDRWQTGGAEAAGRRGSLCKKARPERLERMSGRLTWNLDATAAALNRLGRFVALVEVGRAWSGFLLALHVLTPPSLSASTLLRVRGDR